MRHNIPARAIKIIQENLRTQGLYSGPIDGIRTSKNGTSRTDIGIDAALGQRASELVLNSNETSYKNWSEKRKAVGYFQLLLGDEGHPVGLADGFWGPQTDAAYELKIGALPQDWRDDIDSNTPNGAGGTTPNNWPLENAASLTQFYGKACELNLARVSVPWTMKLAWDKSTRIKTVSIHEKNEASLNRIFNEIANTYNAREITDYGLDLFGGSYNCRKKRGGSSMSTHAWGMAIDFDPQRNRLRWGADQAFLARPELEPFWQIWEKEGWQSLGREKNFDWMHVQAAIIT